MKMAALVLGAVILFKNELADLKPENMGMMDTEAKWGRTWQQRG